MKAVLVVIDGLADNKISGLDNKTTFAYARHKNMDRLADEGVCGYLDLCPEGYTPESMVCILNLLGVKEEYYPPGRSSLEALSAGYSLGEDEVALRCNLAAIDEENGLSSFNGGALSKEEMAEASRLMAEVTSSLRFLPLAEYRNLIILEKKEFTNLGFPTYPPHESLGKNVEELLADLFSSSKIIKDFVCSSAEVLRRFQERGQKYIFYPWGLSQRSRFPDFKEMYNRKAAAVCCADIARGIALALGMDIPVLRGITGDTDTDLLLKAKTVCSLLENYDFVFVHINGADEAAHRGDTLEKVRFIERIDEEFITYLLENMEPDTRIMICGDHATDPVSGRHAHLPVPFIIGGSGNSKSQETRQIVTPIDALNFLLKK